MGYGTKQADIQTIKVDVERKFPFMDFWSAPADKITIPVSSSPDDIDFPDIVVAGLPSGLTVERIVLILTSRALKDTSGSNNYIAEAGKTIRIKLSTGEWGEDDIVAMTFAVNSLYCVADTKETGPVVVGDTDIKSVVTGDGTYNVRSEETNRGEGLVAAGASLEVYDVQVGVRVFFS
jgi:hypothetical protein